MQYTLRYAPSAPAVWQQLATIERTGWVMRGVVEPETVQQHTLELLRIAEEIPAFAAYHSTGLREMLEIHDWPEAIVGDEVILEHDEVTKQQLKADKHRREAAALVSITAALGSIGEEIRELWDRYEAGVDETARVAKEIDKYQAVEQALIYELQQHKTGLFKAFRDYLLPVFTHPAILTQLRTLEQQADEQGVVY